MRSRRLFFAAVLPLVLIACSGGGGGSPAPAAPAPTATPVPSGSPGASVSPSATPHATATPTASPTATPTATPSPAPTANPAVVCQQAQAATTPGISPTTTTAFLATVRSARSICMSAYVFTTVAFQALDAAAKSHASVVVVFPQEQDSGSNASDLAQLQADGATIVIDPGTGSTNPIHAKLAVVDGIAYLDGHNWVEASGSEPTDDVIIQDTLPADFTAIESALQLDPVSSASGTLDTLKSNSLAMEAGFLSGLNPGAGAQVHFMTESFSSGASNVVSALETAAQNGAAVNVILVGSDETGSSDQQLIATMKAPPYNITFCSNVSTGSEKVLIASTSPGEVWYGSSNATSSSSLASNYIDWGMLISDATTISAIDAYYQAQLQACTPM
ncbi:MAG TPA: hypothetical protein VMD91_16565 [Candidatus Sulfotelmatobacter sp.]|nr:hypothetical protein [Candidatus Sulfotelmatobacter sp.]